MNILPKKNWHVRTQKNIDRVRKDEALAAEQEAENERRSKLALQEARTRLLRDKARARDPELIGPTPEEVEVDNEDRNVSREVIDSSGHINFFQDVERGEGEEPQTNKEAEAEKKKEQEEYETKVGYLVKLGQDTEELTGNTVWWKKPTSERLLNPVPSQLNATSAPLSSVRAKQKEFLDPLNNVRKYLGCEGVRLTMKKHEKKLEAKEIKAINFAPLNKERKRKRSRSRSRSRSRKKKKRKRSSSREKSKSHKKKKSKKKRRRSTSSESSSSDSDQDKRAAAKLNLEKLRRERLERERLERQKADRLVFGQSKEDKEKKKREEEKVQSQKYNNQFNPDLAKQNKLDPKRKYWLE